MPGGSGRSGSGGADRGEKGAAEIVPALMVHDLRSILAVLRAPWLLPPERAALHACHHGPGRRGPLRLQSRSRLGSMPALRSTRPGAPTDANRALLAAANAARGASPGRGGRRARGHARRVATDAGELLVAVCSARPSCTRAALTPAGLRPSVAKPRGWCAASSPGSTRCRRSTTRTATSTSIAVSSGCRRKTLASATMRPCGSDHQRPSVSPARKVAELRTRFLAELPHRNMIDAESSIFDLAQMMFPQAQIMLREHSVARRRQFPWARALGGRHGPASSARAPRAGILARLWQPVERRSRLLVAPPPRPPRVMRGGPDRLGRHK